MSVLNSLGRRLATLACVVVLALGFGAVPKAGQAATITYIHEGSFGSGNLGGVAIGPALFTITAIADTGTVTSCGGVCLANDHISASINISGLGTFAFVTATRTFVNSGDLVGLARGSGSLNDLFHGPLNAAFAGYDLASDIGPIGGAGRILQWDNGDIVTSGGLLNFSDFQTDAQFTSIVKPVPLPASLGFMVLGLAGFGLIRRRKSQR